jgi:sulfur carrier protein
MDVKVNGEVLTLPEGQSKLIDLFVRIGIPYDQKGIAVAVNMELVPRGEWDDTHLAQGDAVEIITARQGG